MYTEILYTLKSEKEDLERVVGIENKYHWASLSGTNCVHCDTNGLVQTKNAHSGLVIRKNK